MLDFRGLVLDDLDQGVAVGGVWRLGDIRISVLQFGWRFGRAKGGSASIPTAMLDGGCLVMVMVRWLDTFAGRHGQLAIPQATHVLAGVPGAYCPSVHALSRYSQSKGHEGAMVLDPSPPSSIL